MNYSCGLKEAVGMVGRPASRMLSYGKCQLWKSIIVMPPNVSYLSVSTYFFAMWNWHSSHQEAEAISQPLESGLAL